MLQIILETAMFPFQSDWKINLFYLHISTNVYFNAFVRCCHPYPYGSVNTVWQQLSKHGSGEKNLYQISKNFCFFAVFTTNYFVDHRMGTGQPFLSLIAWGSSEWSLIPLPEGGGGLLGQSRAPQIFKNWIKNKTSRISFIL